MLFSIMLKVEITTEAVLVAALVLEKSPVTVIPGCCVHVCFYRLCQQFVRLFGFAPSRQRTQFPPPF